MALHEAPLSPSGHEKNVLAIRTADRTLPQMTGRHSAPLSLKTAIPEALLSEIWNDPEYAPTDDFEDYDPSDFEPPC